MSPDLALAGRIALVTGGGQGIGAAIALALSQAGAAVAVAGRNQTTVREVVSRCGPRAVPVTLDVTDEQSCSAALKTCGDELGTVDLLVNNAGIAESAKFTKTDNALWERTMAVDVTGPFWLMRAAVPAMVEQGRGTVISIGSLASRLGLPYVSAYTAAKHALLGLTRALAAEYARTGVTFNCICPYYVDTPMAAETIHNIAARTGRSEAEATEHLLSPQGRLISPDEVAAMCVLLASPAGASITGQAINIDGGKLQS